MRTKFTILLTLLFLTTLHFGIKPIYAETETKWVLDNVIVGEGGENIAPNGTRREGSFLKSTVSQETIVYQARTLDYYRKYDYTDATFTYTLPSFPEELQPGQQVELTATGQASGYMKSGYFGMQLEFRSSGVALSGLLDGEEVHGQFGPYLVIDIDHQVKVGENWETVVTEIPDSGELFVRFDAPSCNSDNEFSVGVFLWNGLYASVDWVYRCEQVEPEYGVIEKDGELQLISPPGEVLEISLDDLPEWARSQIVTVGDMAICVGPPDTIMEGDASILLDGKPVTRVGDLTGHGGTVLDGSKRIFVNGVPAAIHGGFHVCPMVTPPVPHVGGPIVTSRGSLDATGVPRLVEDVHRGSKVIEVDGEGIEVGDALIIGNEAELSEMARVIDKGSLVLDRPLKNSYPAGTLVTRVPDEYSELVLPPTEEELAITSDDLVVDENIDQKGIPGFPIGSIIVALLMFQFTRKKDVY